MRNRLSFLVVLLCAAQAFALETLKPVEGEVRVTVPFKVGTEIARLRPDIYLSGKIGVDKNTEPGKMTLLMTKDASEVTGAKVLDKAIEAGVPANSKEYEKLKNLEEQARTAKTENEKLIAKNQLAYAYVALTGLTSEAPKTGSNSVGLGRGSAAANKGSDVVKIEVNPRSNSKGENVEQVQRILTNLRNRSRGPKADVLPELAEGIISRAQDKARSEGVSGLTAARIELEIQGAVHATKLAEDGATIANERGKEVSALSHDPGAQDKVQSLRAQADMGKDTSELLPDMVSAELASLQAEGGNPRAFLEALGMKFDKEGKLLPAPEWDKVEGDITKAALINIAREHRRIMRKANSPEEVDKEWEKFFQERGMDRKKACEKAVPAGGGPARVCPALAVACPLGA